MTLFHYLVAGMRQTSWRRLLQDIAAIALVLCTPYAVNAMHGVFWFDIGMEQYVKLVHGASQTVAVVMVAIVQYRLYRAGHRLVHRDG